MIRTKANEVLPDAYVTKVYRNSIVIVEFAGIGDSPENSIYYQEGVSKEQLAEYNAWAKSKNEQNAKAKKENTKEYAIIKGKNLEKYQQLYYNIMTPEQRAKAEPFPDLTLNIIPPQPHPGYLKNYNAWAGKLAEEMRKAESNKQYPYPIIKRSEIEKYRNIYDNILSDEQLKQALPFPKIAPPPPPPPAPEEPKIKNYDEVKSPSPSPKQPHAQNTNNKVIIGADSYSETPKTLGIPAANGTVYRIKDIIVTGNSSFNDHTIITFSRLNKGDKIIVGGEKIKEAISRLWSSNLFKSVDIYLINTDGDETDLEIRVVDRPKQDESNIPPPPSPPKPEQENSTKQTGSWGFVTTTRNLSDTQPPPPPPAHPSLLEALEDIIERKVPIEYKGEIISNEEARKLVKQGTINLIQEEQIKQRKVILHDDFVLPKPSQSAKKTNAR
jgi:hypothetical protein